ncbi:MAG: immunoglobulin domain-containing protein [Verrucomicrobia bacterium]|nr:immunoglobulin domain-containing protein [Verrucomicrobiota bacterium]
MHLPSALYPFRHTGVAVAWLLLLLQRTPVLRLASGSGDLTAPTRIVVLLRGLFTTAASLGSVHTLAGATTLTTSVSSPASATVGVSSQIAFAITGSKSPAASWTVSGSVPPGMTFSGGATSGTINVSTLILSGTPTTAGSYTFSLRGWEKINAGPAGSITYSYTVNVAAGSGSPNSAPVITSQPVSVTVAAGGSAAFTVGATGSPTPGYQWRKDGVAINGATTATLSLTGVQAANAGTYTVVVSNTAGSLTSGAAVLTVTPATSAGPVITSQPASQHVTAGTSVAFTVAATGAGLTYQWLKDGTVLAGATGATLSLGSATASAMGFYAVRVGAADGTITSSVATLTVQTGGASRLVNVSTRGYVPAGGALTPGFVLQGTASKSVLIRAVGPTLGSFGVSGTLPDPVMEVIPLGRTVAVAANDDWGGLSALATAFGRVGAFPLAAASSTDASVETALPATGASGYTVRITAKNPAAAGIALAEVYDEEGLAAAVRLVNVSTSGFVGTGDQALVPGFVIGGTAPKQLLIRAVGPGLAQFGVSETLPDPQLSVVPLGKDFTVAANDNWGGSATLQAAFASAGAFALPSGSNDAAVLLRLPPGGYTVVVSGAGGQTGTALVEVYDLDP